jgi:hypothetical protein
MTHKRPDGAGAQFTLPHYYALPLDSETPASPSWICPFWPFYGSAPERAETAVIDCCTSASIFLWHAASGKFAAADAAA